MHATAVAIRTEISDAAAIGLPSPPSRQRNRSNGLFPGVATWPDLNEIFDATSRKILANDDVATWLNMGGREGCDGRLGFGAFSSNALGIIEDIMSTSAGFRWTDAGMTWAVRCPEKFNRDHDKLAIAVTYRGSAWLLDADVRRRALRKLNRQLADHVRPPRSWDADDRRQYARLAGARNLIRLVDGAERILARLIPNEDGVVRLSIGELCSAAARKPRSDDESSLSESESSATLHATTGFSIAQLRLGAHGWDPSIVAISPAVSEIRQCDPHSYQVHVSPLLGDAINLFNA